MKRPCSSLPIRTRLNAPEQQERFGHAKLDVVRVRPDGNNGLYFQVSVSA